MNRLLMSVLASAVAAIACGTTLFVEAEGFETKGGWVADQQFMDQMGSPFLMAHGMGTPVADASTAVTVPKAGTYRVLARTRNWTAPWSKIPAGTFKIALNGRDLPNTLGTGGTDWTWQEAGSVKLAKGKNTLALRDLTGFNGRCDAVILTDEAKFVPPADVKALDVYRRKVGAIRTAPKPVKADLVVVGGGVAGICTAISAARQGLRTVLIQDRPLLGGCNSSEVRVHLGGRTNIGPYKNLGDVVNEIGPAKGGNAKPGNYYEDARKMEAVLAEKNIRLFLNTHATDVKKSGSRITAVRARNIETNIETIFEAPLFVDCTGDANLGALAGADFRMGREAKSETGESRAVAIADTQTMGASVQWYSRKQKGKADFPVLAWAHPGITEATCQRVKMGEWTWETGMRRHQVDEAEYVRDYGMYVVYSNWNFLKNKASFRDKYASYALEWVAYVAGKRESRRLMGDYVLRQQDLVESKLYKDGTACTTWTIDLHYPNQINAKHFPKDPFLSYSTHIPLYAYPIPYRCLYSRNVSNLFMAGRNISVTHVALGTVRVMRTTGMMGEVVGMAAAICKKNRCSPRDVYRKHLGELRSRMERGVGTGKPQPPQTYNCGNSKGPMKTYDMDGDRR